MIKDRTKQFNKNKLPILYFRKTPSTKFLTNLFYVIFQKCLFLYCKIMYYHILYRSNRLILPRTRNLSLKIYRIVKAKTFLKHFLFNQQRLVSRANQQFNYNFIARELIIIIEVAKLSLMKEKEGKNFFKSFPSVKREINTSSFSNPNMWTRVDRLVSK